MNRLRFIPRWNGVVIRLLLVLLTALALAACGPVMPRKRGNGDGISLRSSDTKPRERLLFSPLEDEPAIDNLPEPIALTANYQQFPRRSRDRAAAVAVRDRAQFELHLQGQGGRRKAGGARVGRALCARRKRAEGRQPGADYGPADRYGDRLPYLGRPVASSVVGAIEPR